MSKAILIMDMPKSCSECPLFGDYYKDMICRANGYGINYPYPENFRQEWCPMRGITGTSSINNIFFEPDYISNMKKIE